MADVISKASFDPHVEDEFLTQSAGGILALRLAETRVLGPALREGGAFSLTFQGPSEPFLEQATYRMRHQALTVTVPVSLLGFTAAVEKLFAIE